MASPVFTSSSLMWDMEFIASLQQLDWNTEHQGERCRLTDHVPSSVVLPMQL